MYRVNTFEIYLPALRERIEDIPSLARHLLARHPRLTGKLNKKSEEDGVSGKEDLIAKDALSALCGHIWPGNVRELANVIEHATILCDQGPIGEEHLPQRFDARQLVGAARSKRGPKTLRDLEAEAIHEALQRCGGSKPKAAEELGVSIKTLYNRLNQAQADTLEKTA